MNISNVQANDSEAQAQAQQELYCPETKPEVCAFGFNKCCSDTDCPSGQLCCNENCGNECQWSTSIIQQDSGRRAENYPDCKIKHYFP
jgi:hypothetical protein